MKAILKQVCSPELPGGGGSKPSNPENFWISVSADIGLTDSPGADTFTIYVTTPKYIQEHIANNRYFMFGIGVLVLQEFDWDLIEVAIQSMCRKADGENWQVISAKLAQLMRHEFTNYPL